MSTNMARRNRTRLKERLSATAGSGLYPEMFKGMRDGLTQPSWKKNAKFVGYGGFGPSHFARWPRWLQHSLYTADTNPERIDPSPYIWDGGSPSYYLHDWSPISDFRVWSPQVESMNWIFMLKEARRINPDFWFELSVWDGGVKKHKWYEEQGQTLHRSVMADLSSSVCG